MVLSTSKGLQDIQSSNETAKYCSQFLPYPGSAGLWIVSYKHSWKFLPAEEREAWTNTARPAYFSPLGPKSQPQTCLHDFHGHNPGT